VAFVEKLREEQNFSSIEELKTQLHCDKLQAISALAKSS
jgi:FAD synthase